jgi:hypothetical protein
MATRSRFKDLILLVLTGIVVFAVAAVGVGVAYVQGPNVFDEIERWIGLVLTTFVVFWYFIGDSRRLWRVRSFWFLSGSLLFLHLAVFCIVLWYITDWRLVYFIPLNTLEAGLFTAARDRLMLSRV